MEGQGTVADIFRSASYFENRLEKSMRLYRIYSESKKDMIRSYWARTKPTDPYQATIDLALDVSYKNKATHWIEIDVPAETTIYEGVGSNYQNELTLLKYY